MKKIISMLLAVVMVLSLGSVSVFADDTLLSDYDGEILEPTIDPEWGSSSNYFKISDTFYGNDIETPFIEKVISLEEDYRGDWWEERGFNLVPEDVSFTIENIAKEGYYFYVELKPYTLCPDGVYHNEPEAYETGESEFPNFEYVCEDIDGLNWGGNMPVEPLYEDFVKKVAVGEKIEIKVPNYIENGDAFLLSMIVYESETKECNPEDEYPRMNSWSWLFLVDTDVANRYKNGEIIDTETYVMPTPVPEVDAAEKFTDVMAEDYYYDPINWAIKNDITMGTSETTFSPNDTCTHDQILTFLWRAKGSPVVEKKNAWVKEGEYYTDALNWAASKGLIDEYYVGTSSCSRYSAVKYMFDLSGEEWSTYSAIPMKDLSENQKEAVSWAIDSYITMGTSENTFSPEQTCTRGQIITFLYRGYAY